MTAEEKDKTLSIFADLFEMYVGTPDYILEMYFELSEAQAIPNTKKTTKCYSVALWMAYLMSLKDYNETLDVDKVGVTSKSMGDRSDSFAQGNNLAAIQRDPRGFLAQYKSLYDQYSSNSSGMFFMSIGNGHN